MWSCGGPGIRGHLPGSIQGSDVRVGVAQFWGQGQA